MLVFVCDRFCTVFAPYGYPKVRPKVLVTLMLLSLLFSAVLGIVPYFYKCIVFSRLFWFCFNNGNGCNNQQACVTFRVVTAVLSIIIDSVIPLVMYVILFIKARKVRLNMVVPAAIFSGQVLERKTRERKANYTFLTLFSSTFSFTSLSFLHFIVDHFIWHSFGEHSEVIMRVVVYILGVYYDLLPIVDSIAIMRNFEFRCALKKLKHTLRDCVPF